MHKFYSSKAFQFFAIAIISSLCLLLNSLTIINFHKMELPKTNPQYNAVGIDGSVYNTNGKLLYSMQAESAWEYPNDDKIYLKKLAIEMYDESKDWANYTMSSNSGWIDRVNKTGYLGESTIVTVSNSGGVGSISGNPRAGDHGAEKSGTEKSGAGDLESEKVIHIYSENINLNLEKNTFGSNAIAHVEQGKNSLYTQGFSYDNNKHFLILESKVRIVYYVR